MIRMQTILEVADNSGARKIACIQPIGGSSIGKTAGLRYVYLGNAPETKAESTFCYDCGRTLIERVGYKIVANNIDNAKCPDCGAHIAGFEL